MIEHAVHGGEPLALPALAARLGVTDRHLRRIFQAAHGVSPHDYLSTQRLLLAKQLLTDTHAARDAGGAGQRLRQPAPLQRRLRRALPLQPHALRARTAATPQPPADAALRLAYRPPYDVRRRAAASSRGARCTGVEAGRRA